ncbi:Rqc2 family fibronectin-binding protein [Haloplasma contractile]|uniref:Rqc2 homolog RqcH n=1 Tax=Haloplasma contractile SSD-17B TaxID=1033810 RepID=U2FQY2_9MOLU|nr:NFACT RNA binding domain-containing protein [Haloplasma contractile]ERJ13414.1 Fibronectin-fibrinogen-binding protein putative [Haloplasma contractile SSD-17B]
MAIDGVFTHFLVDEIDSSITSGRINKIYQLSNNELIFVIRANRVTQKLLISTHPSYARTHLTNLDYIYPKEPPMFCMLLRKHLEGGIIKSITQKGNDRIIMIEVLHTNEIGDKVIKKVIIEIMGKHSNFILVDNDTNKIIDCIKHISPFLNSYRTLQPGANYIFPPSQDKINPFKATRDDFKRIDHTTNNISRELVKTFEGVSPLLAREIMFNTTYPNYEAIYNSFHDLFDTLKIEPTMKITEKRDYYYLFDLKSISGESRLFDTLSKLLDRVFYGKDKKDRIKQQTQDLERFIKNELDKNVHKIENLNSDLEHSEKADEFKLSGELLTANAYMIKKGEKKVQLENYYSPSLETIDITLDPRLDPIENAQKYFTKYQKAKNSVKYILEQIELTKQEIRYFETLYAQIASANINDAMEIRQELEDEGYLKRRYRKKKKNAKPKYETYYDEDGVEILVGKNNIQNEYLTHKVANRNETWMHAKDIPGSHVIVRTTEELSETTIRTAAQLAAFYSKGKQSSSVPIDYTKIKNVKKIAGSKPGFVTYDHQKTIFIDPDEEFILNLSQK